MTSQSSSPPTLCVCTGTPRQALEGLLQPLLIPHRPWPHITLDFVTGLPPSDGNLIEILTVVDMFSKAGHLIPLPKLPSAKETAQLMVQHVFQIHGLPVDMVSPSSRRRSAPSLGHQPACPLAFIQSNGQLERANQDLEMALHCLVSPNPTTWNQQVVWVEYSHNILPCLATGLLSVQCSTPALP
jgi:hypothetical protein